MMMSSLPLATKKGSFFSFWEVERSHWPARSRVKEICPAIIFFTSQDNFLSHTHQRQILKKNWSLHLVGHQFPTWFLNVHLLSDAVYRKYQVISCCKIMVYHQASRNSSQLKSRYWRKPVMDSEFCERGGEPYKKILLGNGNVCVRTVLHCDDVS